MKQLFYFLSCCMLILVLNRGQVNAQTTPPVLALGELANNGINPAASVELATVLRGFLPTRLTTAQRNAINGGVVPAGLMVYNTDINCLEFWNGSKWASLCDCDCDDAIPGSFDELSQNKAVFSGEWVAGQPVDGQLIKIPYTGGNGGAFRPVKVYSGGVEGLTLYSPAGRIAAGADSLVLWISGTPATAGIASFRLVVGERSFSFSRQVGAPATAAIHRRRYPGYQLPLTQIIN